MWLRYDENEYGTQVSVHECETCGNEFTLCPAKRPNECESWANCLAVDCASYDPARDVDKMFEEEPWRIQREGAE